MKKSKQITFTINLDILQKVDNFARANGVSRSSLITTALVEYINQKESTTTAIKQFLQEFVKQNKITEIKTEGGQDE